MAAKVKWENSLNVLGIPLTDVERDTVKAAWEQFSALHEDIHGAPALRKQFVRALLLMGAQDVLAASKVDVMKALMERYNS